MSITAFEGNVTFAAAATGTPTPTVQWQAMYELDGTWTNIQHTSDILTVSDINPSDDQAEYRAVFSDAAGTATRNSRYPDGCPKFTLRASGPWRQHFPLSDHAYHGAHLHHHRHEQRPRYRP